MSDDNGGVGFRAAAGLFADLAAARREQAREFGGAAHLVVLEVAGTRAVIDAERAAKWAATFAPGDELRAVLDAGALRLAGGASEAVFLNQAYTAAWWPPLRLDVSGGGARLAGVPSKAERQARRAAQLAESKRRKADDAVARAARRLHLARRAVADGDGRAAELAQEMEAFMPAIELDQLCVVRHARQTVRAIERAVGRRVVQLSGAWDWVDRRRYRGHRAGFERARRRLETYRPQRHSRRAELETKRRRRDLERAREQLRDGLFADLAARWGDETLQAVRAGDPGSQLLRLRREWRSWPRKRRLLLDDVVEAETDLQLARIKQAKVAGAREE